MGGAAEALTGQPVTAQMELNLVPLPPDAAVTYTWTVKGNTGTNPYKDYDTNAPDAANATQLVKLTDKDYAQSGVTFYDETNNETLTWSCTATFPNTPGAAPQKASGSVTFMKPTVTAWGVNTGNDVQTGVSSGTVQAGTTTDDNGNTYSSVYANEVWGPITIAVPSLGSTNVSGQGCIAQVIQSTADADTRSSGTTCVSIIPNGSGGYVVLPTPALDTAFPYPLGYLLDANGHINVTSVAGSSAFSAPGTGYSGDQPKIQIFPDSTSNWTSSTLSIHFGTWVMYQPKGGIWVPLQTMTWDCEDTAMPSAGGPISDPAGGPNWAAPTQKFNGGTPADTPNYPQWIGSSAGSALGVPSPP